MLLIQGGQHDGFDVIVQGLLVAIVEHLRVVVRRLLRAHVVNRRVEVHVLVGDEVHDVGAIEDALELGDAGEHVAPPVLEVHHRNARRHIHHAYAAAAATAAARRRSDQRQGGPPARGEGGSGCRRLLRRARGFTAAVSLSPRTPPRDSQYVTGYYSSSLECTIS